MMVDQKVMMATMNRYKEIHEQEHIDPGDPEEVMDLWDPKDL